MLTVAFLDKNSGVKMKLTIIHLGQIFACVPEYPVDAQNGILFVELRRSRTGELMEGTTVIKKENGQ